MLRLLVIIGIFCNGCASLFSPVDKYAPSTFVDYEYVYKQRYSKSVNSLASAGLTSAYRNKLGNVLFSKCKNAPSDSTYLMLMQQNRCDDHLTFLHAVARLMREANLPDIHPRQGVLFLDQVRWVDFPPECRRI